MESYMTIARLKQLLSLYDDETEIYFGGLELVKIKNLITDEQTQNVTRIMFEFKPSVYETKSGKIAIANEERD
ncbi:hypothetical protein [uncultured Helicobacter sp.]|uniref:hypothetical protein n=1 Tax=uncultured Helicobacter sp. TaxID=175537 RepID=UPI00374E94D6